MPIPNKKYKRGAQPPKAPRAPKPVHTADKLDMRQVQQLQRINKEAMAKHKFHQERNQHMQNMINRQKAATFESELDRFEHARLQGPLTTESNARLERLKELLSK